MECALKSSLLQLIDHWIDGSPAAVSQIPALCRHIELAASSGQSTIGDAERKQLARASRLAARAWESMSGSMGCAAASEYSRRQANFAPVRVRTWEG